MNIFGDVLGGKNSLLPYSEVVNYYSTDNESNVGGEKYSFGNEEVGGGHSGATIITRLGLC